MIPIFEKIDSLLKFVAEKLQARQMVCVATISANENISANTDKQIMLNSLGLNDGGFTLTGGVVNVPAGGLYEISGTIRLNASAVPTSTLTTVLSITAGTVSREAYSPLPQGKQAITVTVPAFYAELAEGAAVKMQARFGASGSITRTTQFTRLNIKRVR